MGKASSLLSDPMASIVTAKRRHLVLKFRKEGKDYRTVARLVAENTPPDELPESWSERFAAKDVSRVLKTLREDLKEEVQTVRELELSRLDKMLNAIWDGAIAGEVGKIDRVLTIMARRAKYIPGVEAPTEIKTEFLGKLETSPDGLNRSISTLATTINSLISGQLRTEESTLESGERETVDGPALSSG